MKANQGYHLNSLDSTESLLLHTKIQDHRFVGCEEEDYYAWRPFWSFDRGTNLCSLKFRRLCIIFRCKWPSGDWEIVKNYRDMRELRCRWLSVLPNLHGFIKITINTNLLTKLFNYFHESLCSKKVKLNPWSLFKHSL